METENQGRGCISTSSRCYAYFICCTSFMVQFIATSFYGSFGPLYVELLRVFKEGDAKTAWIASISFSITYIISPITYRLDQHMGQRNSMILGSILFGLGLLISSFATSLNILFFTIGIMLAVGHSFCQAASMFVLPHYFGKNYSLPLGIVLSGSSIGSLALSSLKELLFRKFEFRKGMQILSGSAVLMLFCGLTFKRPKTSKTPRNEPREAEDKLDDIDERYPPLLSNKAFYMLLVASFVYHSVYLITFVHLTRLAGDLGVSDTKAALLPGILALTESVGKVFSGKILSLFDSKSVTFYQIAWLGMAVSCLLCPLATNFLGLALYSVGWGFCVGCANGACVLVIRHLVGNKHVVRGYSVFLMCFSPAVLVGPPLAGWLREKTQSYDAAFYVTGGTFAVASALLFIVKLLDRMQRKTYFKESDPFNVEEETESSGFEEKDRGSIHKISIIKSEINLNLIEPECFSEKNISRKGKEEDPYEEFHCNIERIPENEHLFLGRETDL